MFVVSFRSTNLYDGFMNGPQNLAREVKKARIEAGFDRANAFARSLGVTPKTISNIETAARNSYSAATLMKLDNALSWKPGTAEALLSGSISKPSAEAQILHNSGRITVQFNDYDEQVEIEAPDVRIIITSHTINLEADYRDTFSWADIPPEKLVEAGYQARSEFMTALDRIKVESIKPIRLGKSCLGGSHLKDTAQSQSAEDVALGESESVEGATMAALGITAITRALSQRTRQ